MNVLITGHRGQLGRALFASCPAKYAVLGADLPETDIADPSALRRACAAQQPDLIINAAAYTAVDKAEDEPDMAHRVNAEGPRVLAEYARDCSSRLIHISTDFVFDGSQSSPYAPGDNTNPLSVYGASKRAGEVHVGELLPEQSLIIRTAWLYSAEGGNFVKSVLRLLTEKPSLGIVADQIGSPTWAASLASTVWLFAANPALSGIYHWTDAGAASWYDFAVAIQEEALAAGLISAEIPVLPLSTEQYPTPATRPPYSVLDKQTSYTDLGITPVHWRSNLRLMLNKMDTEK